MMEPSGRYNEIMYIEDQTITSLGLVYSIILFILFIVKHKKFEKENSEIHKHGNSNLKSYRMTMKIALFLIFISNVLYMLTTFLILNLHTILPNYNHTRNLSICHIQHIVSSIVIGCYLSSILIYFSIRLEIMLKQTPYQYSSKTYLIYRITVFLTIFTVGAASCASYNGSYNVSLESWSDIIVCSGVESTQLNTMGMVIGAGMFWIFILNVVIWYMFFKKLIIIIKSKHVHQEMEFSKSASTATATTMNASGSEIQSKMKSKVVVKPKVVFDEYQLQLLGVIKKQTLMVGIICLSTITFWGIHSLYLYGYVCLMCDAIINISCIFLSLVFTKDYYVKLGCERLSEKCCGCVERYAISKVMEELHESKQYRIEITPAN